MIVRGALDRRQRLRRHLPPALFLTALAAALLAIARPNATVVLPSEYLTLVLAIDVSRSMLANDIKPSRIVAAQSAAKTLIEELPTNVRIGVVSFAGTAAVALTPTDSREDMLAAIDRFQLQRHTATGSGLLVSLSLLFPDAGIDLESAVFDNALSRGTQRAVPIDRALGKPRPKALSKAAPGSFTEGSIILLSDGRRTTGPDPVEVARLAADLGVRVYTVGFGSRDSSSRGSGDDDDFWAYYMRLDEDALKAVAKATGGEYFHASSTTDLSSVYRNLTMKLALERRQTEITSLFAAASALLMLLAFWLSLRWFPSLPVGRSAAPVAREANTGSAG